MLFKRLSASLLGAALGLAAVPAWAWWADRPLPAINGPVRSIPAGSVLAMVQSAGENLFLIGDVVLQLAPGAQIRDAQNRIVLPISVAQPVPARFTLDAQGKVSRIWLLSDQELAAGH